MLNRRQAIQEGIALAGLSVLTPLISYSKESAAPLSMQDSEDFKVINAGIGGNNSIDLLARIDQDCLSHHPKLTILMVGTNDMNSVKHVPLNAYAANLNLLVKKIKAGGSQVLIMSILPAYEPYLLTRHPAAFYLPEGVSARRNQVNEAIKKVAKSQRIHFLDLGHRFEAIGKIGTDKDSLIQNEANSNKTDGIHPTANGYRFIALAVYDYITAQQLPGKEIVCFGDSITKGDGSIEKDSYPAYLKKLLS